MVRTTRTQQPTRARRSGGRPTKEFPSDTPDNAEVAQAQLPFNPPAAPPTLREEGKARWKQICLLLHRRGVLESKYFPIIEHLCRSYDTVKQMDASMTNGIMIAGPRGRMLVSPVVALRTQVMILIRTLLNDLGLTPASDRGSKPPSGPGGKPAAEQLPTRGRDDNPFPDSR